MFMIDTEGKSMLSMRSLSPLRSETMCLISPLRVRGLKAYAVIDVQRSTKSPLFKSISVLSAIAIHQLLSASCHILWYPISRITVQGDAT